MKSFFSSPLTAIALTIIVSTCVAIVATVIINDSLDQYAQRLGQEEDVLRISQERPDPLPGSYEEALVYVKEQAGDRVFVTYAQAGVDLTERDVLAVGAVVTSDGWVLIAGSDATQVGRSAWIDGVAYDIDEVISIEYVTLAHVAEATGLIPFSFGVSDEVAVGEYIFGFGALDRFFVTTLIDGQSIGASCARSCADYEQSAYWLLQDDVSDALIVNAAGDLVAVSYESAVYPIHYSIPWLQSTIRGEEYTIPRLGISVRWLDALLVTSVDRTSGALVQSVHDDASVFVVGDVITRVGNRSIDANTPIAETFLGYDVGDTVTVTFIRDGEAQEVDVELLGDNLVY